MYKFQRIPSKLSESILWKKTNKQTKKTDFVSEFVSE